MVERLWVYLLYPSTIFALGGGAFPRSDAPLIPIQDEACRGLAVKEWNRVVDGEVIVVLVIGQCFGLEYSGTANGPGNIVIVQGTLGSCVSFHNPLCSFYCKLCPAIRLGIHNRG